MSVRNIVLILAAVLIMAGTGLVARSWLADQRAQMAAGAQSAPQAPIKKIYVLVADADLPTGSFIKEENLTWQVWPDDKLHASYMIQENTKIEDLLGAVVRRAIAAGEPISTSRILKPGDRGFLAAVLRPGYRAVAVRVDATSSISGLVFPGDRVDIMLTHSISNGESQRRATETVLTNVRVLAIDQKVDDTDESPKVGKNATLEVTPKQAEMLAVLADLGKLSFALRSLAKDQEELERIANSGEPLEEPDPERGKTHTWDSEVSRLIWRPSRANQDVVQVSRGSQTEEVRFNKK
jgi:pilus assembly protein CpaB